MSMHWVNRLRLQSLFITTPIFKWYFFHLKRRAWWEFLKPWLALWRRENYQCVDRAKIFPMKRQDRRANGLVGRTSNCKWERLWMKRRFNRDAICEQTRRMISYRSIWSWDSFESLRSRFSFRSCFAFRSLRSCRSSGSSVALGTLNSTLNRVLKSLSAILDPVCNSWDRALKPICESVR